jgi:hypothetical protein
VQRRTESNTPAAAILRSARSNTVADCPPRPTCRPSMNHSRHPVDALRLSLAHEPAHVAGTFVVIENGTRALGIEPDHGHCTQQHLARPVGTRRARGKPLPWRVSVRSDGHSARPNAAMRCASKMLHTRRAGMAELVPPAWGDLERHSSSVAASRTMRDADHWPAVVDPGVSLPAPAWRVHDGPPPRCRRRAEESATRQGSV